MKRARASRAGRRASCCSVAIALPLVCALLASLAPERALFGAQALVAARAHARALPRAVRASATSGRRSATRWWSPRRPRSCASRSASLCAYALARLRFRGAALAARRSCWRSRCSRRSRSCAPLLPDAARRCGLIDTYPGPGAAVPDVRDAAGDLAAGRLLPPAAAGARGRRARRRREPRCACCARSCCRSPRPALATTAILTFVYCWNEFLFALSFTLGPERQTVPVAIALFRGQYQVPWGQILAATSSRPLPVAVLVLVVPAPDRHGLTAGAVKG